PPTTVRRRGRAPPPVCSSRSDSAGSLTAMATKRLVISGGGPAVNQCATHAARLRAPLTLIQSDIVAGAAHLLDCIPSKAMIATGGALSLINQAPGMGISPVEAKLDFEALKRRITSIEERLQHSVTGLLESQGVTMIQGRGRLNGP